VTISFQKNVVVPNFRLLPPWQMDFPPKKETGTSSKMNILVFKTFFKINQDL